MSPDGGVSGEPRGPIAYMASNPVAANFLMAGILVAGLVSLTGLEREAWPTFRYHMIEVTVPYPGANPQEVEESVVIKIEEHVSSLDGVKSVRSVSAPGIASVQIEAKSSADIKELMDDVESAVGRIRGRTRAFRRNVQLPERHPHRRLWRCRRALVEGDRETSRGRSGFAAVDFACRDHGNGTV
ncbi:MAG: efflux RND transporter permease subunit [Pseudomonadales bacterium]|nr:efflux RND transporter permease subunit [Pseudomonadales bacterium]